MISYRSFRNTDPPALVRIWNDAFGGRAVVPLRSATLLEYFLLAKSYFDPEGLQVAVTQDGVPIGWVLGGFGPDATGKHLDYSVGIVCMIGVLPTFRGKGVAGELLRRCENYLTSKGARTIYAGPLPPANPYTFGLYGGSQSPGFLESNEGLGAFLLKRGYEVSETVLVLQRVLDRPFNVIDGRFPALRRRFEVKTQPRRGSGSWYDELVRGPLDFLSFQVEDRTLSRAVGHARIWEMEPFSIRWNESAVGILDIHIDPAVRRQGVARLLMGNILRFLHDQYFTLVETQVPPENEPAVNLFRGLGFQQIDVGRRYRRKG